MIDVLAFDSNAPANSNNSIFGLPCSLLDAYVHILPVPWDVTTSYIAGTSRAPGAVKEASYQVDLYDAVYPNAWQRGYFYHDVVDELLVKNDALHHKAKLVIEYIHAGKKMSDNVRILDELKRINEGCAEMNEWVYEKVQPLLSQNKRIILLGGDHSTPFGYLKALSEVHPSFGLLVIDAHLDLRKTYQGFEYSHASIMYNLLENIPQIAKTVIVGARDYCDEELAYVSNHAEKIEAHFDHDIACNRMEGVPWKKRVDRIIAKLPEKVYISVDVDGLDCRYCPNTGTPVLGGLDIHEKYYLLDTVRQSGRTIIGGDLSEVGHRSDSLWDANVGARILYKLCNLIN